MEGFLWKTIFSMADLLQMLKGREILTQTGMNINGKFELKLNGNSYV